MDDEGVLFIGKGFKRGKGFLPWFDNRDDITGLVLQEGMEDVVLPDGLEKMCSGVFEFSGKIKNAFIPDGVKVIPSYAFFCCESLQEVRLPEQLEHLGYESFANCTSLSSFRIPDGVPMLDYAVLASCPIKEIVIPESVTEINNSAFYECPSLKKVFVRSKVLEDLYWVPDGCEIIKES